MRRNIDAAFPAKSKVGKQKTILKWLTVAIFLKWQDCCVAIWLDSDSAVILREDFKNYLQWNFPYVGACPGRKKREAEHEASPEPQFPNPGCSIKCDSNGCTKICLFISLETSKCLILMILSQ